jgi:predicted HicB family RNase H-like nuclease
MDFIIKKPTSSNRTIRMPDTLIDKLNTLAAEKDISFNQLVIQCCEFALENLKQPVNNPKNAKNI